MERDELDAQGESAAAAAQGPKEVDLLVIGAGSAGFAAAIKGAELGFQVALVESGAIGGTCVNVGCVPSKTLIRALAQYHEAGTPRFAGVQTKAGGLNWQLIVEQKERLVAQMRRERYVDVLAAYPAITFVEGYAHLTSNGAVIDGQTYRAGKIVVAAGARPWAPPLPGLEEAGYLTSTTAMALLSLPGSLLVLGGSAVGLELAQMFSRAGVAVTIVELLPRLAPFEDEDIGEALHGYLAEEGVRVVTGFTASGVEKRNGRYFLSGIRQGQRITLDADQLLVATGRQPNSSGMGLEEAGVKLGDRGQILVGETLQTDNPDIYAAGDVIGDPMFVYVAAYSGGLAAENALAGAARPFDINAIPRVTFTDPQIASTGLTEAQARERGHAVEISVVAMDQVPRALAARDTRGLIKLVVERDSDHLLGAHVLAPEAGEVIQTAVLALRFGLTASQLRETLFPYLTNVEGLKLAALALEKDVTLLSCCAG